MLKLPFHRKFVKLKLQHSFETGLSSEITILTTLFRKNEIIGVWILSTVHNSHNTRDLYDIKLNYSGSFLTLS